jgi:predicted nucleic acid-binding protein
MDMNISGPVELACGASNEERSLGYVEVLDFPDEAASHYAKIRAHLKRVER